MKIEEQDLEDTHENLKRYLNESKTANPPDSDADIEELLKELSE